MKTKFTTTILVTLLLVLGTVTLVQAASTPASFDQTKTTTVVQSPLAGTTCRIDSYYTGAANIAGSKLYKYILEVSWCYDGKKAWVTGKNSYSEVYWPGITYKGATMTVLGDNTRYFTVTGSATFTSRVAISTKWGTLSGSRNAYPWVKMFGYYYGNTGFSSAPF